MFGFRNASETSRFAQAVPATIAAPASAVSVSHRGYNQSVEEHQGCGNDQ